MIKLILPGPPLFFLKAEHHKRWKLKSSLILSFTMASMWHLEKQTKKLCHSGSSELGSAWHARPASGCPVLVTFFWSWSVGKQDPWGSRILLFVEIWGGGCCLLAQPRSIQWELIIFIAAVCNGKRHAYYVLVHTLSASHPWLWVLAEALRDFKFSVWNGHLCRPVGEI